MSVLSPGRVVTVTSRELLTVAHLIRSYKRGPRSIPGSGVKATAAQLETAAEILIQDEPEVLWIRQWERESSEPERPGFVSEGWQDDPDVLVFRVGTAPGNEYRIDRRGDIIERRTA